MMTCTTLRIVLFASVSWNWSWSRSWNRHCFPSTFVDWYHITSWIGLDWSVWSDLIRFTVFLSFFFSFTLPYWIGILVSAHDRAIPVFFDLNILGSSLPQLLLSFSSLLFSCMIRLTVSWYSVWESAFMLLALIVFSRLAGVFDYH